MIDTRQFEIYRSIKVNTLIIMQTGNNKPNESKDDKSKELKVDETKGGVREIEVVEVEEVTKGLVQSSEEPTQTEISNASPFLVPTNKEDSSFTVIRETASSLEAMKSIARELIGSQLCPLKKESDVIVAIITGNQYGFHFMTSVNQIFPINGKPTMSVHLQRALLITNKVIFNKILDAEPIYEFGKLTEDKSTFDTVEVPGPNGQKVRVPKDRIKGTMSIKPPTHGVIKQVDTITKYSFTRMIRMEDGSFEKLNVISEYKHSDAHVAGLLDKDNWVKHLPRMLDARAFAIGAREIASDILLGVYSVNELADEYNVKYTVSASGEETVQTN